MKKVTIITSDEFYDNLLDTVKETKENFIFDPNYNEIDAIVYAFIESVKRNKNTVRIGSKSDDYKTKR